MAFWVTDETARVGRPVVAEAFYESLGEAATPVDSLYATLLNRSSDPAGRTYWAEVIRTDGDLALAAFLASSDEYFALAQADPTC